MHECNLGLAIGGTLLEDSDKLDISGVTFDYIMTIEKHLHSFPRAVSQRLGILRMSCGYSTIDCFLGDASKDLSFPFWSTVLLGVVPGCRCTPLPNCVVSGV